MPGDPGLASADPHHTGIQATTLLLRSQSTLCVQLLPWGLLGPRISENTQKTTVFLPSPLLSSASQQVACHHQTMPCNPLGPQALPLTYPLCQPAPARLFGKTTSHTRTTKPPSPATSYCLEVLPPLSFPHPEKPGRTCCSLSTSAAAPHLQPVPGHTRRYATKGARSSLSAGLEAAKTEVAWVSKTVVISFTFTGEHLKEADHTPILGRAEGVSGDLRICPSANMSGHFHSETLCNPYATILSAHSFPSPIASTSPVYSILLLSLTHPEPALSHLNIPCFPLGRSMVTLHCLTYCNFRL